MAAEPMDAVLELRPRGVLDLIDSAVRLYRRNFTSLLAVPAVVIVPLSVLQIIGQFIQSLAFRGGVGATFPSDAGSMAAFLVSGGINCLAVALAFAFGPLSNGALAAAVSEKYLGRTLTVKEAYGRAFPYWGWLFLVAIVYGLIVSAAALPSGVIAAASIGGGAWMGDTAGAVVMVAGCTVAGVGGFLLVGLTVATFSFYMQAMVLEGSRGMDSLQRSRDLVRGHTWHALWTLVLAGLAWVVVYMVVALPIGLAQQGVLMNYPEYYPVATLLFNCVASTIQVLLAPVFMLVQTLLYYDLRIRNEGFDLQMMAAALAPHHEQGSAYAFQPVSPTTAPAASPLVPPVPPVVPLPQPPTAEGPPPIPPVPPPVLEPPTPPAGSEPAPQWAPVPPPSVQSPEPPAGGFLAPPDATVIGPAQPGSEGEATEEVEEGGEETDGVG